MTGSKDEGSFRTKGSKATKHSATTQGGRQRLKHGRAPQRAALLLAAILATLLMGVSCAIAAADEQGEVTEPASPSAPLAAPGGPELEGERTATSQTFMLPDGALETRLYGSPVNYQDPQGDWKPIDEGFEEQDNGRLTNGPNSFDISLPEHLGEDPVRLGIDGAWVTTELLGAEPEAVQPEDATATYESAGNGADFEFANLADGLKEEIVLAGPSQPSTFSFQLDASNGLTPVMRDDGSVQFRDANGQGVVTLPAPVMSDSAEPTPATSRDIHYILGPEVEGHWRLTVEADRDWLTQPDRSWPVRLDPTMTISSNLDCIIGGAKGQTGWIDCASWGRKVDLVDSTPNIESSKDSWQRGLLYLETSDLPANATVSSATFNIYSAEAAVNTSGAELLKTSKPWTWEASWSRYAGPTKLWTTEGGDTSETLGQVLTSQRGSQAGWWQFTLPAKTVEAEAAKAADLGTLLKLIDDKTRVCGAESCTQRSIPFSSSAATDTTKRPYLSVVYTVPTAPTVVGKAATLVKGTTATLNAGVNPNGASTTYQFEYGTTTAYGKVAPATGKAIGSGKAEVAVAESVAALSSNTLYHFRITATNSLGKSVSEDKTFTTLKLPAVTTEGATAVTGSEALIFGSVNPNGWATTYQFEYGPTTSYGTTTPTTPASIGSGTNAVPVQRIVTSLTEGTAYHFRIKASSEAGVAYGVDKTLTTADLPDTTIGTSGPTYTGHTPIPVTFSADQAGSTFKCSIDEAVPTNSCSSPYSIPSTLKDGWHTLRVAAVNAQGYKDATPATYTFNPAFYPAAPSTSKLISPSVGEQSTSYFTLQAESSPADASAVSGVTFQVRVSPERPEFQTIPPSCVIGGDGKQVSWPIPEDKESGRTSPVFLKVRGCPVLANLGFSAHLLFRALYDGSAAVAGASEAVATEYLQDAVGGGTATDATKQIGPATLDLVTGQYTIRKTDVSIQIPGSEATLEFTRTYESDPGSMGSDVLGHGWQPSGPMDQALAGEAWTELRERHMEASPPVYDEECEAEGLSHEECMVEEEAPAANWIELRDNEGAGAAFEIDGGAYVAPDYMKEYVLSKQGSGAGATFELADPNGTHMVFTDADGNGGFEPTTVSFQSSPKAARMVYKHVEGTASYRLVEMIAAAPGVTGCSDTAATKTPGCRALTFQYDETKQPFQHRLTSITYYNSSGQEAQKQVVARYEYDASLRLIAEWDPRVSPELKETYTYNNWYKLGTLTPPGQQALTFSYYEIASGAPPNGRLRSVSRPSLLTSPVTAQTTIAYGVPISGSSAPYQMGAATVATWGQTDFPVNATAIFPPTQVPNEVPSDYSQATVVYMDPDGYAVNTASEKKPGASGQSISTAETDRHGNVIRELSPQNRLTALEAGANSAAQSRLLDSHRTYSGDGTEMLESFGPQHKVRLESGAIADARAHVKVVYDEFAPTPPSGTPMPHLPTMETTSAMTSSGDVDQRVTQTHYNWSLRKPELITIDPGLGEHLNINTFIAYDPLTGQESERALPGKFVDGKSAHVTDTIYYTAGAGNGSCGSHPAWAGLLCEVKPEGQPGTAGQPEILVTKYKKYSALDQPEEIVESPGGGEADKRITSITYDSAGRVHTKAIVGGGEQVPPTEMVYAPLTGLPVETKYSCAKECATFDNQAVKTFYDTLGRVEEYEDADGVKSKMTYDIMNRPVTITDGKGTQTRVFDPTTGMLTSLEDSAAGKFTARYNADGAMVEQMYPNGLTATRSYDATGVATNLSYVKTTMCSTNCTWLEFSAERSINEQVVSQASTLSKQVYSYDKAGRLTRTLDTPSGGACTTRSYSFDSDSNRTKLVTRAPGVGGACDTTSAGTTQSYSYDAADRLISAGPSYDGFGRLTNLPANYASSKELVTHYFSNDMVATQSQGGVTNTFQLDATGRQRQRLQGGGLEGIEVFHYTDGSDMPAWTIRGSAWSRNVVGIGGELAAVQDSSAGVALQLTNLHGDVVGTASLSQSATKLLTTSEADEFGNPKQAGSTRFGWLGGKQRRTELSSGVIQMGARSYVPAIGRFLSTDPVAGGSANDYDYANADPVNGFDTSGNKPYLRAKENGCEVGMHAWSPRNRNGSGGYGKFRARLYVRCGSVHGSHNTDISYIGFTYERGPGSGNVIVERELHLTNEGTTQEPHGFNNWNKGRPIEFDCLNGSEYQLTLTIEVRDGLYPSHEMVLPVQEYCNHGRY